jgi:putative Holliday junction resolvase
VGAILGVDLGEKRVGLAVSDPEGLLALPLALLDGSDEKGLVAAIACAVSEREAERVVIGLPRHLSGALGERAEASIRFRDILAAHVPVPVELWDERLSSAQAERILRVADGRESEKGGRPRRRTGRSPRKADKGRVDRIAAVLILQAYLDHRRNAPPREETP